MVHYRYDESASTLVFSGKISPDKNPFSGKINVFVCGALQNPEKMNSVLGQTPIFAGGAVTGYHRGTELINGNKIPFMKPAVNHPSRILTGIIWLDLSKESLKKIEEIELEGDYRKPLHIPVQTGELVIDAITYVKK
jgi:Gamma-glutamyl cyclotransferase, AIG2-like